MVKWYDQPIDWTWALLFLIFIGVIMYIIGKKRREVFERQQRLEKGYLKEQMEKKNETKN